MTFPFDVVKTRMQGSEAVAVSPKAVDLYSATTPLVKQDGGSRDRNPYRTTMSTIIHSYRNEGIGVFFRGLAPTLIRCVVVLIPICLSLKISDSFYQSNSS